MAERDPLYPQNHQMKDVKAKFRLYGGANGIYYCEDAGTGKQGSLGTAERLSCHMAAFRPKQTSQSLPTRR